MPSSFLTKIKSLGNPPLGKVRKSPVLGQIHDEELALRGPVDREQPREEGGEGAVAGAGAALRPPEARKLGRAQRGPEEPRR